MKKDLNIIGSGLAFALGGLVAFSLLWQKDDVGAAAVPQNPVWTEMQWPFPVDEWGMGKAFHCEAANCGTRVNLYLRAKIGFCNCAVGIADDDELARLTDFHLLANELSAIGEGRPISVAGMKGRSRTYAIVNSKRSPKSALTIAFNDRCDAIVATVTLEHDQPKTLEPAVVAFLNSDKVVRWAEVTLGL